MHKYKPSQRHHDVAWMLTHSQDLEEKAIKQQDSSKVLYCCLELRNALEMVEFHLILASLESSEHEEISEMAKKYQGINKANDKLKSLKEKTQEYYECVCEELGIQGKFYDFKKSGDLKYELSQYIHTYTRTPTEMIFEGQFIKGAFPLIKQTREFIMDSLIWDGKNYIAQNLDYNKLSSEDQQLLGEWKHEQIDKKELRRRISENRSLRGSDG